FVRELMQNADDCEYGEGDQPTISVRRTKNTFLFQSNERGFLEPHVRAICSFADSSKTHDKSSFIGEKGLGFKSVFQISDRPEVHSNGYHFRFDRTQHGGLGREIPEWIEGCEESRGTRIELPIRADAAIPLRDPDDLRAEQWILLFLRKLNSVQYHDEVCGRTLQLEKHIEGEFVNLSHRILEKDVQQNSEQSFRIEEHLVDVSSVAEPKRSGFRDSTVAVAVPRNASGRIRLDCSGRAFAYLPIEETELRFSFNADLLLDTSRSGALENQWNKTLCDGLGCCLVKAIMRFCTGGDPAGGRALGMLRHPSVIKRPLYERILAMALKELNGQSCIPTAQGKWVKPSKAVLRDDDGLVDLIEPMDLERLTGVELVHQELKEVASEMKKLGVRPFSFDDLANCLKNQPWMNERSDAWFRQLYSKLGAMKPSKPQLELLRMAPILRLQDGSTKTPHAGRVYRGMETAHTYGFESLLPLLASQACVDGSSNSNHDAKFLDSIDVCVLTPKWVIDEFILPQHEKSGLCSLTDVQVVAHACFIIDHFERYEDASRKAKNGSRDTRPLIGRIMANLKIVTRSDQSARRIEKKASNMYLGEPYQDPHDLEGLWASQMPERFISHLYRDAKTPDGCKKRDWAKFFLKLRARDTPGISMSNSGEPPHCGWRKESKLLFQTDDEKRIWHFLRIVGREWEVYRSAIERRGLEDEAELLTDLRAIKVQTTLGPRPLRECFLGNADNRAVFGEAHPFLCGQFFSDEFAEVCGVVTKPTIDAVLKRLQEIATTKATDDATVAQVDRLYRYLADRVGSLGGEVKRTFETNPIILAGSATDGWVTSREACWSTGGSLEHHCPLRELAPRWKQFRGFFVDHLKVPGTPTPQAWIGLLESVKCEKESEVRARLFTRFAYLGLASALDSPEGRAAVIPVLKSFETGSLLLCKDGQWRSKSNAATTIVFGDDAFVESCFAKQSTVAFIALDVVDGSDVKPLLRELQIGRLRKEMKIEV
ncbi:MAG: hypothetical protein HQ465_10815, partial [Rhodospirillales bacterium]|nr:hypothetical protein [Rhodospirillales bacterium]